MTRSTQRLRQHIARIVARSAAIRGRYGWRGVSAKVVQKLATLFPMAGMIEALQLADRLDFTPQDLARSQALQDAHAGPLAIGSLNWFLPDFEHAYYGGVHTILRFAAEFAAQHDVASTFVIVGNPGSPSPPAYTARIAEAFPGLGQSRVLVLRREEDLASAPWADASIASAWPTAYSLLKFNQTNRKFYFIQDFEPMFYPAGSISAQAEATYHFGFYGIANTITLAQDYHSTYGGSGLFFTPNVDTKLFYPDPARALGKQPLRVFFYARPGYQRNGFELGAAAMRLLKQRLGARVQIVAAGQPWNPAHYGLRGVVENLGLLSYQETAALYRTCDAGLAMMFTRHPSYLPLELMASGCLVISNLNQATSWLLNDQENCLLSLPSASSIAATLARGLEDAALRERITGRALAQIRAQYADWAGEATRIFAYMSNPHALGSDLGMPAAVYEA
jgi:hypothetical protein